MGVGVGIDLGTTNTVVAVARDGQPVTLADEGGRRLIPSFVSFHPSGRVLVGEAAKERRVVDPENTISSIKRLIGRTYASDEVQRALRAMPFELVEGDKQAVRVVARGEIYTLPEISAFVLRRAKAVAEAALGEVVDKAVITVPANFNDPQRAATKLAGKLAGLEVLRILNEPTAAALAYGQAAGTPERVAVYDLGGGTFDVTLLDLSGSVFEVLATGGDTSLGGDDVDHVIVTEMTSFFLQRFRFDPRVDPVARASLRARAERLKHALSEREESSVEMNDIVRGDGGAFLPATFSMDRKRLEELTKPLIDRTIETCRFSIETIGLTCADIDRVLLVGGATRMPMVARQVEEYFKRPTSTRVNPDEVVAMGAALQAAALTKGHSRRAAQPPTVKISRADREAAVAAVMGADAPAPFGAVAAVVHEVVAEAVDASPPAAPPRPRPVAATGAVAHAPPEELEEVEPDFEDLLPELIPDEPLSQEAAAPRPGTGLARPSSPPVPASFDAELHVPERPQAVSPPAPAVAPALSSPDPGVAVQPPPARSVPLLVDVTPISLGVEVAGGYCDFLIRANTPVPCDRKRVFRTASDGQTAVVVRVVQGESEKFSENTYLGDLELTDLPPAPRGEVEIAVTFEIDADGILNVRATDQASGRETLARINLLGAQSDASDVAAMLARQRRHDVA
jgi:molecular chaperone DnaK